MKKISITCFLFILLSFVPAAYAEYYIVYDTPTVCDDCYSRCYSSCECRYRYCYHYIRSVAPHRHNTAGSGEMSEYEWVGDP